MSEVTILLDALSSGKKCDAADLLPLVYDELRRLAAMQMMHQPDGHTLQPTALVHEAWLRIAGEAQRSWKDRSHFFATAAQAMRCILVDHARRKSTVKHGGEQKRVDLEALELAGATPDERILLMDDALTQLEKEHPERARVVVLKYFGGMTNEEVARMLGTSERTVNRHWLCARAWLFRKLQTQA